MLPSVYGFAEDKDVDRLIRVRTKRASTHKEVAALLGEAVFALLEINSAIPVQAKHRHLVASALENFAEPKT